MIVDVKTFLNNLVYWFGGVAECWKVYKTNEMHFAIKNNDVGYYHFTVPLCKIECINDIDFKLHLFNDYLATMRINTLKWEEMFNGL